jgi:hypothetical protein
MFLASKNFCVIIFLSIEDEMITKQTHRENVKELLDIQRSIRVHIFNMEMARRATENANTAARISSTLQRIEKIVSIKRF